MRARRAASTAPELPEPGGAAFPRSAPGHGTGFAASPLLPRPRHPPLLSRPFSIFLFERLKPWDCILIILISRWMYLNHDVTQTWLSSPHLVRSYQYRFIKSATFVVWYIPMRAKCMLISVEKSRQFSISRFATWTRRVVCMLCEISARISCDCDDLFQDEFISRSYAVVLRDFLAIFSRYDSSLFNLELESLWREKPDRYHMPHRIHVSSQQIGECFTFHGCIKEISIFVFCVRI